MEYNFYYKDTSVVSNLRGTPQPDPAKAAREDSAMATTINSAAALKQFRRDHKNCTPSIAQKNGASVASLTNHAAIANRPHLDKPKRPSAVQSELRKVWGDVPHTDAKIKQRMKSRYAKDFDFHPAFDRDFRQTFGYRPIKVKTAARRKAPMKPVNTTRPTAPSQIQRPTPPSVEADDTSRYPQRNGRRPSAKALASSTTTAGRVTKTKAVKSIRQDVKIAKGTQRRQRSEGAEETIPAPGERKEERILLKLNCKAHTMKVGS